MTKVQYENVCGIGMTLDLGQGFAVIVCEELCGNIMKAVIIMFVKQWI
jgi:hypothetical protein